MYVVVPSPFACLYGHREIYQQISNETADILLDVVTYTNVILSTFRFMMFNLKLKSFLLVFFLYIRESEYFLDIKTNEVTEDNAEKITRATHWTVISGASLVFIRDR